MYPGFSQLSGLKTGQESGSAFHPDKQNKHIIGIINSDNYLKI
jgi:hypothetical protein